MANFFQRDVVLHITPNQGDGTALDSLSARTYKVPVLEGFSFSQTTNSSDITLSEMESTAGVSRRGRRVFNDSLAPAEWSFSTYVRPFLSNGTGSGNHEAAVMHAVEEVLWNGLLARGAPYEDTEVASVTVTAAGSGYSSVPTVAFSGGGGSGAAGTAVLSSQTVASVTMTSNGTGYTSVPTVTFSGGGGSGATGTAVMGGYTDAITAQTGSTMTMNTAQSDVASLNTMTLEFQFATGFVYTLAGAVVNSANISFDVDGIATIEWSGFASTVTEKTANSGNITAATISEGQRSADTGNFIRNRLSTLVIDASATPGLEDSAYALTLTGGNISIDNGITYLTPDTLGTVNTPLAHVTGTRNISGAFTCYLASGTRTSQDWFQDFVSATTLAEVSTDVDITFNVGGASNSPRASFQLNQAHVEVPSHSIDEVLSLETNFHAVPSDLDTPNDMTINLVGPAVASS